MACSLALKPRGGIRRKTGSSLLRWALLLAVGANGLAASPVSHPPNLIIILADDLGYADLGIYGNSRHRTPQLDALAREGMRFTDFHANGSLCSPTRAALLTGRYQQRSGVEAAFNEMRADGLTPRVRTLPKYLEEGGYVSGLFGKWHLGSRPPYTPEYHGFDEFRGLLTGDGDYHSHVSRAGAADWWHNGQEAPESGYTTELLTRHAIDFIERNRDRPFFLYLAHLAVHFPWQGPDDRADRVVGTDYFPGAAKFGSRANKHAAFREMVEALDDSVGQVIEKLRELRLERNTLVVFLSDNGGYTVNEGGYVNVSDHGPFRGQKEDIYEGGHRVPAIAWWPGRIGPGLVCAQTVMTMDLLPTFLELAGLPPAAGDQASDGSSLCRLLFDRQALPERTLFWRMKQGKAVREGPWKFVVEGDNRQLFNLDRDPGEQRSVLDQEPARARRMQLALEAWETDVERSRRELFGEAGLARSVPAGARGAVNSGAFGPPVCSPIARRERGRRIVIPMRSLNPLRFHSPKLASPLW